LYFSKNFEDPRRILKKILVSKFLLNLLVEILKVLPNSEIYLNSKIKTLLIFSLCKSAQPAEAAEPAHSFLGCRLPHPARQPRVLRRRPARFPPSSQQSALASSCLRPTSHPLPRLHPSLTTLPLFPPPCSAPRDNTFMPLLSPAIYLFP
jgi:hypothetical protein